MEFLALSYLLESTTEALGNGELGKARADLKRVWEAQAAPKSDVDPEATTRPGGEQPSGTRTRDRAKEAHWSNIRKLLKQQIAKSGKKTIPAERPTTRSLYKPAGVPEPKTKSPWRDESRKRQEDAPKVPRPGDPKSSSLYKVGAPSLPNTREPVMQHHAHLRRMQFDAYSSPPSHLQGADKEQFKSHQAVLRGHLKSKSQTPSSDVVASHNHVMGRLAAAEGTELADLVTLSEAAYGTEVKNASVVAHQATKAAQDAGTPEKHGVAKTLHHIAAGVATAHGHHDLAIKHMAFVQKHMAAQIQAKTA